MSKSDMCDTSLRGDEAVDSISPERNDENVFPSSVEPKKKKTRRRPKARRNGKNVEVECIVENIETLTIAADTSVQNFAVETEPLKTAEVEPPPIKKKKPRKKKASQSLKAVVSNQTIPGMLYLTSVEESSVESQNHIPSCSLYSNQIKNKSPQNDRKPGYDFQKFTNHVEIVEATHQPSRTRPRTIKSATFYGNQSKTRSKTKCEHAVAPKTFAEEPSLNENKFEDHLQRELVEVMLKEQIFVIKGTLRINQRNFREAYISNPDGGKDILIDGVKSRNRGLEGDEVAVQILPESAWKSHEGNVQKTGKVIHILTPVHHRQAIGTLKKMADNNSRNALFSPRDSRVPRMRVPLRECPKNPEDWNNQLFCARISEWDDVRFAKGHIVGESIGIQGDIESETLAIMMENELNFRPYAPDLSKYFPTPPYHVKENDFIGREDLRNHCIFTIDPITAKDLDDAVSCEVLDNGNYKIGVHISDVSYFLSEGTPLDKAVSERATTTYLVHRVFHMLPRELTMMCSLLPGEDKLAFSVFWEITPDAIVLSHYFTRSVINSCAQLSYEHAQAMIDDPDHEFKDSELPKIHGKWCANDLKTVVCTLHKLAVTMRKQRFDEGALRVDQTKLIFEIDDLGLPASLATYVNKESHRLIEEFMLLANMTVATALQKRFPKIAFLRCHDEPQADMMKRLADTLEKIGIFIDVSSAGALQKSLKHYNTKDDHNAEARYIALNVLCSKPMARARYFCAGSIEDVQYMRHYALNVPLYTHFTSPIRRYADVMVHRLLSGLMGYAEEPKWSMDHVNKIASNCNKQKFCAKKAGEQSIELFFALWVGQCGSLEEDAVVIDVKDHSFDAIVCSTGTLVRVYTDKLAAAVEFFSSPLPQLKIVWTIVGGSTQTAHQLISLFSVVRVALRKSVVNSLKIEATLIPPSSNFSV